MVHFLAVKFESGQTVMAHCSYVSVTAELYTTQKGSFICLDYTELVLVSKKPPGLKAMMAENSKATLTME